MVLLSSTAQCEWSYMKSSKSDSCSLYMKGILAPLNFTASVPYMFNIISHVSSRHITKPDKKEVKNFLYQKFRDLNLRKTISMDLNPS
jgi:hypothetical protein